MPEITPTNPTNPTAVAPGTPPAAPKKRKGAAPRDWYPGLNPQQAKNLDGSPRFSKKGKPIIKPSVQLKSVPADYSPKKHRPLGVDAFENEDTFFEFQISRAEKRLEQLKKDRETAKSVSGIRDKGAAKKLRTINSRIDELLKSLEGKEGVDLDAIKAKLAAKFAGNGQTANAEAQPA